MQTSLFRFKRKVEEERKRKLAQAADLEPCGSKQRRTGGKPVLKEATACKLQGFRCSARSTSFSPSVGQKLKCVRNCETISSADIPEKTRSIDDASALKDSVQDMLENLQDVPRGEASAVDKRRSGKSVQYTPLEQQYLSMKASHPDAILFVECGYKFRFFGEDAEVASRVLQIGCFFAHNFNTASIPVYRLNIHLRRLVAAGYKVGVVRQVETAALKAASDNKSGPFERKLAGLYTRSTLVGSDIEEDEGSMADGAYLICVGELLSAKKKGKEITLGFLAVQPSAGNMVYDEFVDDLESFSELELRLSHIRPVEVLYPSNCSHRVKQTLVNWTKYNGNDLNVLRTEALPESWYEYNRSFSCVTSFYGPSTSSKEDTCTTTNAAAASAIAQTDKAQALQVVVNLPPVVLTCLGALIEYLRPFGLQGILSIISNLRPFSSGVHCMRLGGKTLSALEVFKNLSDQTEKGTLFSILDHAHTAFGRRLLVGWVLYPLTDVSKIRLRQAAVRELSDGELPSLSLLKSLLHKLPDLERKLCSVYHKKSSPGDFFNVVRMLGHISEKLSSFSDMAVQELKSQLLVDMICEIPSLLGGVEEIAGNLCERAARKGDFEHLFVRPEMYPDLLREKKAVEDIEEQLQQHRRKFRVTLHDNSLGYITVSGDKYLVEVKNKDSSKVPSDWYRVSSTKQVTRYRPPYVIQSLRELTVHQEQLVLCAKQAWMSVLDSFSCNYVKYKMAVDRLAELDCLLSLAEVAKMPGYMCPEMVEEVVVEISGGRHPVIDLLLDGGQYVANDTKLHESELRCMVVTGPNMGGKSSYIKQVALICILAQIGSFVPAHSARLGALDGIYTRMGAYDSILSGQSTFMVELQEAAFALHSATPRSLVILDELGRGTSTHDGASIALASLLHFIEHVRCFVLFVTHYPMIGDVEKKFPAHVANYHMAHVTVEDAEEVFERVVFLYHLENGLSAGSYGLNVASLAGLPEDILQLAHKMSVRLEQAVTSRLSIRTFQLLAHLLGPSSQPVTSHLSLSNLRAI